MIRITQEGSLDIRGTILSGWRLKGDGEVFDGDFNDLTTQAGLIVLAAALIHIAGYQGFHLVSKASEATVQ